MKAAVWLAVAMLGLPLTTGTAPVACPEDHYMDLGAIYVDDEPTPYVYQESNAIDALQRTNDGNVDGHCAHPNPDTWLF